MGFVARFTSRPEFGVARMPRLRGPSPADLVLTTTPHAPQPTREPLWPDDALTEPAAFAAGETPAADLAEWHAGRGIDFANEAGFGLMSASDDYWFQRVLLPEDADPALGPYLVGFEPHAAREPPGEPLAPAWTLLRVELIGLVGGSEPVAYQSPELPRMGETSRHRVRSLTPFEAAALPKLAAGDWVVAAADGDRLRAVGALPAAAACAACHGVEPGRLLGALSYDFARTSGAATGVTKTHETAAVGSAID